MKRPYQIASVVLILFSVSYAREALELRYYTTLGPGPGFFPFWLALIMILLASFMFYHATWRESDPMPADFFATRVGYLKALAVIVAIIFVTQALTGLGFRLTMATFFVWLLFTLGRPRRLVDLSAVLFVTLVGSWGAFWLFNDMLKVPLPVGIFGV